MHTTHERRHLPVIQLLLVEKLIRGFTMHHKESVETCIRKIGTGSIPETCNPFFPLAPHPIFEVHGKGLHILRKIPSVKYP